MLFKKPGHKTPMALLCLLAFVVGVLFYWHGNHTTTFDNTPLSNSRTPAQQTTAESTHNTPQPKSTSEAANPTTAYAANVKPRTNQRSLSPEMQAAVKKLLYSYDLNRKVITLPDGRFELPSNGRFHAVPVAVQQPDGTLTIQEISVIRDDP